MSGFWAPTHASWGVENRTCALRVIPGRFMAIEQAMGIPKGRDAGARYLHSFAEEMKSSGFIAKALAASGQTDATVAPPERGLH